MKRMTMCIAAGMLLIGVAGCTSQAETNESEDGYACSQLDDATSKLSKTEDDYDQQAANGNDLAAAVKGLRDQLDKQTPYVHDAKLKAQMSRASTLLGQMRVKILQGDGDAADTAQMANKAVNKVTVTCRGFEE